jgi:hypothetical protein
MTTQSKPGQAGSSELNARAATQAGRTFDKIPGFDPAMAPMETDAEAGGAHVAAEGMSMSRDPAQRPPETTTNSAMRNPNGAEYAPRAGAGVMLLYVVVPVAVLLAVLALVAL